MPGFAPVSSVPVASLPGRVLRTLDTGTGLEELGRLLDLFDQGRGQDSALGRRRGYILGQGAPLPGSGSMRPARVEARATLGVQPAAGLEAVRSHALLEVSGALTLQAQRRDAEARLGLQVDTVLHAERSQAVLGAQEASSPLSAQE